MKNQWLLALNIVALLVLTDLLCALQTSFWMQVLGAFPPPQFWLIILTYSVLHRHIGEAVLMTYLITFVLAAYTAEPFEHFLAANMCCVVFILTIKNRVYWPSPNYFMMMTGGAAGLHFLVFMILSQFLDRNPLRSPELFQWVVSLLMTTLFSLPLYSMLKWFDRLTQMDETAESTGGLM